MGKDASEKHRRADRESEPFLLFRRSLLHSPQFSALSTPSRSLILEMHGMFNGANNGTVFLSVRDAAARLGFSDLKAAMRAFNECADLGWLTETIGASFKLKADTFSRARAWRLEWIQGGKCAGPHAIRPLDFKRLSTTQKRRVRERQATLDQYVKSYRKQIGGGGFLHTGGQKGPLGANRRGGFLHTQNRKWRKSANRLCGGKHYTYIYHGSAGSAGPQKPKT